MSNLSVPISTESLLSQWIVSVFNKYFSEHKKLNTDKLFIKVDGFTEPDIRGVLAELDINKGQLSDYYNPIVRTITSIEGFEKYQLTDNETSTWLRNNTRPGDALILLINNITPEAQSLENLFSIDESYLLSDNGLRILFEYLSRVHHFAKEEIDEIDNFLAMYKKVTTPQLRSVVRFISGLLNDSKLAMLNRIQQHLPALNMFRDSTLVFKDKNITQMKENYFLANLQKSSTQDHDVSKLEEKLYNFLDQEEKNDYMNELWESVTPEKFREQAFNFLNSKDRELLNYEYRLINNVFNFKLKVSLIDKVKVILDADNRTIEEEEKIEAGLDAIKSEDVEPLEEFIEEFEEELSEDKQTLRRLVRLSERLKKPDEYDNLTESLIYSFFSLIEDYVFDEEIENNELTRASFRISYDGDKVNELTQRLLDIYLKNIHQTTPLFDFDIRSVPRGSSSTTTKQQNELPLNIQLIIGNRVVKSQYIKIMNFTKNDLNSFLDESNNTSLLYLKYLKEKDVKISSVFDILKERSQYYKALQKENIEKNCELL